MNRLIFPFPAYPLSGDIQSNPGSNKIIVTGLEQVPLDPNTVGNPDSGWVINYSPLVGMYVASEGGGGGGGGGAQGRKVGCSISGNGSTIAAGFTGSLQIDYNATITGWSIESNTSGSISIDVYKAAGTQTVPVIPNSVSNKISASAPIVLASSQAAGIGPSGLTTWSTVTANQWDSIGFSITSSTINGVVNFWLSLQEI